MGKPTVLLKKFTSYLLFIFSTRVEQWHIPEAVPASGENFNSYYCHLPTKTYIQ